MRITILIAIIFSYANTFAQNPVSSDSITVQQPPESINLQVVRPLDSGRAGPDISTKNHRIDPALIAAGAFMGYGVIAQYNTPLRGLDLKVKNAREKYFASRTTIDDYLQYLPALSVYAIDLMGTRPKHDVTDRTLVMAVSHAIMGLTVQTLKHTTTVPRPDGSNTKSFPSGHTATAFVGAHILYKEYGNSSPWIGISGYMIAGATGALRIVNNKHWLSDVVAGAGIGIVSTEIAYLLLPKLHKLWSKKENINALSILPVVGSKQARLSITYRF